MSTKTKEFISKVTELDPAMSTLADLQVQLNKDPKVDVKSALAKSFELFAKKEKYCMEMSIADTPHADIIYKMTCETQWKQLFEEGKISREFNLFWMSGKEQAKLLQFIFRMQKAKNFLEVGMFTGYVSMTIAEILPQDGRVVTCELDPYLIKLARETFSKTPFGDKIDIREGDAHLSLKALAAEGQTFDLVYVDADKEGYLNYFKALLDLGLLAPGGTLAIDNTFHLGTAYWKPNSAVDAFNKAVREDDRVDQILLPLCDGVTLIRRKGE